jgi:hypothetical protein
MASASSLVGKNRYGVSSKYVRMANGSSHESIGSAEELERSARELYEEYRDARDRANAKIEE